MEDTAVAVGRALDPPSGGRSSRSHWASEAHDLSAAAAAVVGWTVACRDRVRARAQSRTCWASSFAPTWSELALAASAWTARSWCVIVPGVERPQRWRRKPPRAGRTRHGRSSRAGGPGFVEHHNRPSCGSGWRSLRVRLSSRSMLRWPM